MGLAANPGRSISFDSITSWRTPSDRASSMLLSRSLRAMVIDTAVTAVQRSPSTSWATFSSSIESTPPEKQTSADWYPAMVRRSFSCFAARSMNGGV